ncbi:MAG: enoyl-CoA hydratase-related protein [Planctomycetota bacterium]|nr:enoyl-CoA hydratase-related protein [Planctomycetota bacterium]
MNPALKHFRIDTSHDGHITIWIDVAERSVNVLFEAVFDELRLMMEYLPQLGSARPLLFRSAKQKGFVVGADLRRILAIESDSEIQAFLLRGQRALLQIEEYPGDTIALIHGPCLGGGLELAMACRYRIAVDTPGTQFGMPESKLGLMPGWGGTQRLIEIVGVEKGLPILIDGEPISCEHALEMKLVDALLDADQYETDISRFTSQLPRQTASSLHTERLPLDTGEWFKAWRTSHLVEFSTAQRAICKAVETGILHSREAGFRAERELFYSLLSSPSVRATLQRFAGGTKKPHIDSYSPSPPREEKG